ncbi:protease complex subunit PrcB family protein [Brevibacillus nitrificans]|uniref:Protease complex subunit PrcB family protein n=1 Tax=Brevibacillus nitrificans TaxID=651560 RepID=A0A3M8CXB6_9BACL|nr:stalk domain-containing protein [Brevibacillus nitrificans]RNB80482.1 protease complex subunit PrcB family protein [Brevibacillus nitrificans]
MKGKVWIAAVFGMQLLVSQPLGTATAAEAPAAPSIYVNKAQIPLQKKPLLVDQRTYITAEDAARIVQADWKLSAGTGVLKRSEKLSFTFDLNGGKVAVNGKWIENGQGALVRNNQVYLPLRWIVEQAGGSVVWNPEKKAVEIVSSNHDEDLVFPKEDQLTSDEKAFIEKVHKTQGIHQQGHLYVIARGESPNPGYSLKVTGTEWSWEQLRVYVKLTKPEPGMMYPQVISYPYLVAKADLPPYSTVVFLDADTKKPLFASEAAE